MTQETALILVAAALGIGLIILAISVFSLSKSVRKIYMAVDELKSIQNTYVEDNAKIQGQLLDLEKKRFDIDVKSKKPRVILIKSGNLRLYEDKQELAVGYSVENLGAGKVLLTKLQIALVNRRTPNLIKIMDMIFNKVVDAGRPFENELVVSAKDFTRISLPFVPDFGFIKDSCQIVASLEYEDLYGDHYRLDKDILEW